MAPMDPWFHLWGSGIQKEEKARIVLPTRAMQTPIIKSPWCFLPSSQEDGMVVPEKKSCLKGSGSQDLKNRDLN